MSSGEPSWLSPHPSSRRTFCLFRVAWYKSRQTVPPPPGPPLISLPAKIRGSVISVEHLAIYDGRRRGADGPLAYSQTSKRKIPWLRIRATLVSCENVVMGEVGRTADGPLYLNLTLSSSAQTWTFQLPTFQVQLLSTISIFRWMVYYVNRFNQGRVGGFNRICQSQTLPAFFSQSLSRVKSKLLLGTRSND